MVEKNCQNYLENQLDIFLYCNSDILSTYHYSSSLRCIFLPALDGEILVLIIERGILGRRLGRLGLHISTYLYWGARNGVQRRCLWRALFGNISSRWWWYVLLVSVFISGKRGFRPRARTFGYGARTLPGVCRADCGSRLIDQC